MSRLLSFVFMMLSVFVCAQEVTQNITGKITDGEEALANVNVIILGKNIGTKTDALGNYSITTSIGDRLKYSYVGFKPLEVVVEDVTKVLNLKMTSAAHALDEVTVEEKYKGTQREKLLEYEVNTNLIRTTYGYLDKYKSGESLNIIDESEFLPGALTFVEAIRGKFNGRITYPASNRFYGVEIYLRERPNLLSGSQAAIYDIDGVVSEDADTALSIPVTEIKRIAILRGLSAVSRYGTRASGGVIVINTKTGKVTPPSDAIEVKDIEEAEAAFVNDEFCSPDYDIFKPLFLTGLSDTISESQAISSFEETKTVLQKDPYAMIDAGYYFSYRWNNKAFAKSIWDETKMNFSNNPNVLKVIAYYFEQEGYLKDALDVYQKVSALRPVYAQTYRDLAYIHKKLGNSQRALHLYAKYIEHKEDGQKDEMSDGIGFMMNIETLGLISNKKGKISDEFQNAKRAFQDSPTRIVLEWNNGETEFDVELKRDDNYGLIWKHSYEENPSQIDHEKEAGYSSKQFFLDKEDVGKWVMNLKYLGNKSFDPSYVKMTIQNNYGTKSQKDRVKVIRLPVEERCVNLASI